MGLRSGNGPEGQNPTFHEGMILAGYLEKQMWTFAKCLGDLLNVLDICKTTWTFTKQPGHLLNNLDIY